jgi:hypothetical protein
MSAEQKKIRGLWVLYREQPERNRFRFVAWLWIADQGAARLHGTNRIATSLGALRKKIPKGFGPDPRFIPRLFHSPSDVGTPDRSRRVDGKITEDTF